MRGLDQDKEVVQSEELTDALVQASAGEQAILGVIDEEKLVDVVGGDEWFGARLDNERWVARLVVVFRACVMGD